ncbi:hypothetical protein [Micrococcus sp. IITD107]|uniref:hypothetical protein n=1 Tax=Micrococcus sp. IITD107 TaxID=3342790 RepID=UPI0035B89C10
MEEREADLDGRPIGDWEGQLEFVILADDPRFTPTHVICIDTPQGSWSVDGLEKLARELEAEYSWESGVLEEYRKRQGGIGADGLTIISVVLGVIGMVPTVEALLAKLKRQVPPRPSKEDALRAATAAILRQYNQVARKDLTVIEETREMTHWRFVFSSSRGDQFEVSVFGERSYGTSVQTLKWKGRASMNDTSSQ